VAYRIFIVEDHPVVRGGYLAFIQREKDLEVCGEAASAEEALEQIPERQPDLALVDVSLKGDISGIELLRQLQARQPDLPVLIISGNDEVFYAEAVLKTGARGYLTKGDAAAFIPAIRTVLAGDIYLSEDLRKWLKFE
jgi:DNA-binding NarL/FixJ family response regulator